MGGVLLLISLNLFPHFNHSADPRVLYLGKSRVGGGINKEEDASCREIERHLIAIGFCWTISGLIRQVASAISERYPTVSIVGEAPNGIEGHFSHGDCSQARRRYHG